MSLELVDMLLIPMFYGFQVLFIFLLQTTWNKKISRYPQHMHIYLFNHVLHIQILFNMYYKK